MGQGGMGCRHQRGGQEGVPARSPASPHQGCFCSLHQILPIPFLGLSSTCAQLPLKSWPEAPPDFPGGKPTGQCKGVGIA